MPPGSFLHSDIIDFNADLLKAIAVIPTYDLAEYEPKIEDILKFRA